MKADTKKALGGEEQLFSVFSGIGVTDRMGKNPELGTRKSSLSFFFFLLLDSCVILEVKISDISFLTCQMVIPLYFPVVCDNQTK